MAAAEDDNVSCLGVRLHPASALWRDDVGVIKNNNNKNRKDLTSVGTRAVPKSLVY